jgi:cell division initiation protein
MTLTPKDIDNQVFKEKFRGYDQDEVDAFLDKVSAEVVQLLRERDELKQRLATVQQDAAESVEAERLLKRTLLTAQRTAEQTVGEARRAADEILARARAEAEQLIADSRTQAAKEQEQLQTQALQLRDAVRDLRRFREEYRERVRGTIAEHLAMFERSGDLPDVPPQVVDMAERLESVVQPGQ